LYAVVCKRREGSRVVEVTTKHDYLEHQLALAFAYYHFVIPHLGLRQRLPKPIPTNGVTTQAIRLLITKTTKKSKSAQRLLAFCPSL
jgi:hypothetical protein